MRWYPNTFYDKINKRFFGNILPKVPVCFREQAGEMRHLYGLFDPDEGKIYLSEALRAHAAFGKIVLIHEMVHVEEVVLRGKSPRRWHGRAFNRRMKQLALMGAFNGLW